MQVIFLSYLNRSGSTFLVNQLSKHPDVLVVPEGEVLVKKLLYNPRAKPEKNILEILRTDHKLKHWNWEISIASDGIAKFTNAELFFHLLESYRKSNAPESGIIVFKAWELLHTAGKIPTKLIEQYQVRYFGLVRDLRAVVASQRTTIYKNKPLEKNTLRTIMRWKTFIRVCNVKTHSIGVLQYEKMISSYQSFFKIMFQELDLTWEESFENKPGSVMDLLPEDQKPLHPSIGLTPKKERIDYWKKTLPPVEIELAQRLATNELLEMGYDIIPVKVSLIDLCLKGIKYLAGYFFVKIFYPSN